MSETTIIYAYPGEKYECGEELKNSWGSATYIWDFMGKTYIPGFSMFREDHMKYLWTLWKKRSIPLYRRAVLMMTFDRALVAKENYKRAAADIRAFLSDHNDITVVNHWPRIAEIFESNPDAPAIGFWMTSVSSNPFYGGWDDEKQAEIPVDWDKFWEVYTSLDAQEISSQEK